MINLGVQYYRAPFPVSKYWKDDLKKIKDSGFNCIQLWVIWAWVESKPGVFDYSDYDRILDQAGESGLNAVLSTVAEIHPYWIHRVIPDSHLITNLGEKVVSMNRNECHNGLTPGGCFDHPEVWKRMSAYIEETARHYLGRNNIVGWDAWNELRWNVHAPNPVCYCRHTVEKYREWLSEKFGNIDGLNKAWERRYDSWEDVQPGIMAPRPYTDMMAFEHFITWRSNQHAVDRYRIIKSLHPDKPVTAHGPSPCPYMTGGKVDRPLDRGNDWDIADTLDGIGCSNFPVWFNLPNTDYMFNMELVKSAARNKKFWVSELQAGRSNYGFSSIHNPVPPKEQQGWIWNSVAAGADTVLLWCWRDEIFGSESNGFGFIGDDGFAEERTKAMRTTGSLFKRYSELICGYRPETAEVAVMFSPQTYYLYGAEEGHAGRVLSSLRGYCKALICNNIPFKVVEEEHLEELAGIKILFIPRTTVVDDITAEKLEKFTREGGTVFAECETGAWDSRGIFRYPEERFTAKLAGIREIGRRQLPGKHCIVARINDEKFKLKCSDMLSPWQSGKGEILATYNKGEASIISAVKCGKGQIILCGTYLGDQYDKERYAGFEDFLMHLIQEANAKTSEIKIIGQKKKDFNSFIYVKSGKSSNRKLIFVFCQGNCRKAELELPFDYTNSKIATDLISGRKIGIEKSKDVLRISFVPEFHGISVLLL